MYPMSQLTRKLIFLFVFGLLTVFLSTNLQASNENSDRGPLSKITFVHYKRQNAKPAGAGTSGKTACYGFIAKGLKWKTNEGFIVNPTNTYGLSESFLKSAADTGISQWETPAGNVFGDSIISSSAIVDLDVVDDNNVIAFGSYPDSNAIAVTNVWGYYSGPINTRQIVEWDMILNNNFVWGDGGSNPSVMDVQNIVTHELGHAAGMADLYNSSCNLETMYGYSTEGETIKRTLNTGDILGITALYK